MQPLGLNPVPWALVLELPPGALGSGLVATTLGSWGAALGLLLGTLVCVFPQCQVGHVLLALRMSHC